MHIHTFLQYGKDSRLTKDALNSHGIDAFMPTPSNRELAFIFAVPAAASVIGLTLVAIGAAGTAGQLTYNDLTPSQKAQVDQIALSFYQKLCKSANVSVES